MPSRLRRALRAVRSTVRGATRARFAAARSERPSRRITATAWRARRRAPSCSRVGRLECVRSRARLRRPRLARIGPPAPPLALELPNGLRFHVKATEVITATAQGTSQDECSNLVIGELEPQCCVSAGHFMDEQFGQTFPPRLRLYPSPATLDLSTLGPLVKE